VLAPQKFPRRSCVPLAQRLFPAGCTHRSPALRPRSARTVIGRRSRPGTVARTAPGLGHPSPVQTEGVRPPPRPACCAGL
jgi:hypothetical protein